MLIRTGQQHCAATEVTRSLTVSSAAKPGCSRSCTKLRSRHSTFASLAPMLTMHSVVAHGTTAAEYTTPDGAQSRSLSVELDWT